MDFEEKLNELIAQTDRIARLDHTMRFGRGMYRDEYRQSKDVLERLTVERDALKAEILTAVERLGDEIGAARMGEDW
jgi:hypothetical protein